LRSVIDAVSRQKSALPHEMGAGQPIYKQMRRTATVLPQQR
jgi:hypothetical protein